MRHNTSFVLNTAQEAGGPGWGERWAASREKEVRLGLLVRHQRQLQREGLVARADEVASARRRYAELMGPTREEQMKEYLRRGDLTLCWRRRSDDSKQGSQTLGSLRRGLAAAL